MTDNSQNENKQQKNKEIIRIDNVQNNSTKKICNTIPFESFKQSEQDIPSADQPNELMKFLVDKVLRDVQLLIQLMHASAYQPTSKYTAKFPNYLIEVNQMLRILELELDGKLEELINKIKRSQGNE